MLLLLMKKYNIDYWITSLIFVLWISYLIYIMSIREYDECGSLTYSFFIIPVFIVVCSLNFCFGIFRINKKQHKIKSFLPLIYSISILIVSGYLTSFTYKFKESYLNDLQKEEIKMGTQVLERNTDGISGNWSSLYFLKNNKLLLYQERTVCNYHCWGTYKLSHDTVYLDINKEMIRSDTAIIHDSTIWFLRDMKSVPIEIYK